ncbi:hypothetical protein NWP09_13045, partial [Agrococcus sp. HG114]|nr:hypothetical protein [Agrococcus sp. HG114]
MAAPAEPITFQQLRDLWEEVLQQLADQHRSAWMVATAITPKELRPGDVLVLGFQSEADIQQFREPQGAKPSVADLLRAAIKSLLGIEVKYIARAEAAPRGAKERPADAGDDVHRGTRPAPGSTRAEAPVATAASAPAAAPAGAVTGWAVATIPNDADAPPEDMPEPALPDAPEPDPFSFVSAPDAPAPTAAEPAVEARPLRLYTSDAADARSPA